MTKTYTTLASKDVVSKTVAALTGNGYLPEVVATGADALARIKELIPAGASVMNGSSTTLGEIGLIDYLKGGKHGWNNLHDGIIAETDPAKQMVLRKQSVLSDYYLGSAHAISEAGEIIIASNSGSQLPHVVFTSPNIILVVSTQKIVKDLDEGMARLKNHVFPLEDARMKAAGSQNGSFISKVFTWYREPAFMGRKVHVLFVEEKLGF